MITGLKVKKKKKKSTHVHDVEITFEVFKCIASYMNDDAYMFNAK